MSSAHLYRLLDVGAIISLVLKVTSSCNLVFFLLTVLLYMHSLFVTSGMISGMSSRQNQTYCCSHYTSQARLLDITTTIGIFYGSLCLDNVLGRSDTPALVKKRAAQLREVLTYLGPSFIKAGQVLANRPDIVREDYMNELCVLQVCCSGYDATIYAESRLQVIFGCSIYWYMFEDK